MINITTPVCTGGLPVDWADLDLTYLDIANNKLSGTLQPALGANGSWDQLQYLNLANNTLTGATCRPCHAASQCLCLSESLLHAIQHCRRAFYPTKSKILFLVLQTFLLLQLVRAARMVLN